MTARIILGLSTCVLALAAIGCGDGTTVPGNDAGNGGIDTGTGGTDTGVPNDAGSGGTDTGTPAADTGVDAGGPGDDAGSDVGPTTFPDGAIMCLAGVECTNWEAVITAVPRNASGANRNQAVSNCVVQLHQADCCGNMTAYGVNHGSRTTLCTAENACTAMYPMPPGCSGNTITVDTGDTTTDMNLVRVRGVPSSSCTGGGVCVDCQTVVCDSADATCLSLEGITAGQCG